jgi:tetratricopeptide (TPR) repeat protein
MPVQEKIRILFLAANPTENGQIQIGREMRAIDQALQMSRFGDQFELRTHMAVRYEDLQELFLRHQPHIVHFSGHGTTDGAIVVGGEEGVHPVSSTALGHLFAILQGNLSCVLLNACYSHVQAEAIAGQVDCVIGMSNLIQEEAAVQFAIAFYRAIGYGRNVQDAFALGCNAIQLANLSDEATPRLLAHRRLPSELVFTQTQPVGETLDQATAPLPTESTSQPPKRPAKPKRRVPQQHQVPQWFPLVGVAFGAITLLFFMGLVIASLFRVEVSLASRFPVVVVLALGAASATTFLGGWAITEGYLPLPYAKDRPLRFSAGGGVAVLLIILVLGSTLYLRIPAGRRFCIQLFLDNRLANADSVTLLTQEGIRGLPEAETGRYCFANLPATLERARIQAVFPQLESPCIQEVPVVGGLPEVRCALPTLPSTPASGESGPLPIATLTPVPTPSLPLPSPGEAQIVVASFEPPDFTEYDVPGLLLSALENAISSRNALVRTVKYARIIDHDGQARELACAAPQRVVIWGSSSTRNTVVNFVTCDDPAAVRRNYFLLADADKATVALQNLEVEAPPLAWFVLARLAYVQQSYQEAITLLGWALDSLGQQPFAGVDQIYLLLGNAQVFEGAAEQALATYDLALAANPLLTEARYNRAVLYMRSYQDAERALEELNLLLREHGAYRNGYIFRGVLYANRKTADDFQKAIDDYTLVINMPPANHSAVFAALVNRARVYVQLEDFSKAQADYERVLGPNHDCAPLYEPGIIQGNERDSNLWCARAANDFAELLIDELEQDYGLAVQLAELALVRLESPQLKAFVYNTLVKGYGKLGQCEQAWTAAEEGFASWSAAPFLTSTVAYLQQSCPQEPLPNP